jgi:hypothetical protein
MTYRSLAKIVLATAAVCFLSNCASLAPQAQQQAYALNCDMRTQVCAQAAAKQCPRGYDVVKKASGIAPLAVKGAVQPPAESEPMVQCR